MNSRLKKGVVFSLFVITAISLVMLSYQIKTEFKEEIKAETFVNRAELINQFIDNFEKDLSRTLKLSTKSSFESAYNYMKSTGYLGSNFDLRMKELILFGTILGTPQATSEDKTIYSWLEGINLIANQLNINISLDEISIYLTQKDAWTINITMTTNVSISDNLGQLKWNYTLIKNTMLDISNEGLPDPVYYIESVGTMENLIKKTNYSTFWYNLSGSINVDYLTNHVTNQFYHNNSNAPSFIMRYKGDLSSNEYGIESFVNIVSGSAVCTNSVTGDCSVCTTDYQFFSEGCSSPKQIENMEPRFKIDNSDTENYNLDDIEI